MSVLITPSVFRSSVLSADATAITENTTLADIAGLSVTLGAGETWFFEAQIFVTAASATPQLKFSVHGSAAATLIRYQSIGNDGGLYPLSSLANYQSAYDSVLTNVSASGVNTLTIKGVIVNGAAESTVTVRIAQNVSSVDAIQVKAGSNLTARRAP